MKKFKKFLTPGFILLFFGSLALGQGFLSWYFVPRKEDLSALEKQRDDMKLLVERLQKLPIPDEEEGQDALPREISVGKVLGLIERAAKEAGIRSISFETRRGKQEGPGPKVVGPKAPDEPGKGGGGVPSRIPDPSSFYCILKVHGRFQALLRFLGKLESSTQLMTVVDLDAVPTETGIQAEIGLEIYFYEEKPGEKTGG